MLMFSCRFETKCARMHQILFQFHFFSGGNPRHWGLCSQTLGEGREGKGKGEGMERGRRGGKGKFVSLPLWG